MRALGLRPTAGLPAPLWGPPWGTSASPKAMVCLDIPVEWHEKWHERGAGTEYVETPPNTSSCVGRRYQQAGNGTRTHNPQLGNPAAGLGQPGARRAQVVPSPSVRPVASCGHVTHRDGLGQENGLHFGLHSCHLARLRWLQVHSTTPYAMLTLPRLKLPLHNPEGTAEFEARAISRLRR